MEASSALWEGPTRNSAGRREGQEEEEEGNNTRATAVKDWALGDVCI